MLTAKDLALIRAALLFFQEENCTGDRSSMKYYFGSGSCRGITAKTARELRQRLSKYQVRFTLIDLTTSRLITDRLYQSLPQAKRRINHRSHSVGTVLMSSGVFKLR